MGHSRRIFFIFIFSLQLIIKIAPSKTCQSLESNCGFLASEVIALQPTNCDTATAQLFQLLNPLIGEF